MKPFFLLSIAALLLSSCKSTPDKQAEAPKAAAIHFSKWGFLVQANARFLEKQQTIPKPAYIFPAIRLSESGQPIDQLIPKTDKAGRLSWSSPAPLSHELKSTVESKLKQKGFRIVTFQNLLEMESPHSISVFNIYYSETRTSISKEDPSSEPRWTNFSKITASTFPMDLSPNGKKDLMQQEIVTLFEREELGKSVAKESLTYLLDHIGENRQWSEMLTLVY